MYLAKDKNGQIGRKVPGVGFDAKIQKPSRADRRGTVFVSHASIENDDKYWKNVESKEIAKNEALAAKRVIDRNVKEIERFKKEKSLEKHQAPAKFDATENIMLNYFQNAFKKGEAKRVADALSPANLPSAPADFSASGGNVQYVRGSEMTGGKEWRADFRNQSLVGNPLTRDGVFGPAVTDYDRYVRGIDVNQTNVVDMPIAGATRRGDLRSLSRQVEDLPIAGGTMLGRYEGQNIGSIPEGMGISFDDLKKGVTSGFQKAVSQVPQKVEYAVTKELQKLIDKGLAKLQPDGKVVVYQEAQPTIQTQIASIPSWAIYSGVGLVGLGLAFALLRKK